MQAHHREAITTCHAARQYSYKLNKAYYSNDYAYLKKVTRTY